MQIGIRNEYRAKVWEHEGLWHVSIETPNAVGGWYEVGLGIGYYMPRLKFLSETYTIYALTYQDEETAKREAERLLRAHRAYHDRHEAPALSHATAEIIT